MKQQSIVIVFGLCFSSFAKTTCAISCYDIMKLERALEAERMSNLELQRKVSTLRNQSHTSPEATEQGA